MNGSIYKKAPRNRGAEIIYKAFTFSFRAIASYY
jgi:hypothetical protein